jgi:hypothetical protein
MRSGSVIAISVLLTVLCLVMVTTIRSPEKDDVAWLLYVARKWLAGQKLYEDLVEVNPPLIIWLYAIPAQVAIWLNASPRLISIPFFASLVLGSAWWCACLLQGRGPLFASRTPVFAVIGGILLVVPGVEFGQREHLLTASVLPYLCIMAGWLDGSQPKGRRWLAAMLAAGAVAGLGSAFKPTYALAFVLPELLGWLRGRRIIRAAPISAFVAAGLYGASVLLFCPAFLDHAVPLALALYGGTDTAYPALLSEARVVLAGIGVGLLLWITSRRQLAARSSYTLCLFEVLITFTVGATFVYVIEGKDWFYHRIPATMTAVLALVLWAAEIVPTLKLSTWHLPTLAQQRPLLLASALITFGSLTSFAYAGVVRMAPWVEEAVEPDLSTEVRLERLLKREHARTYVAFSEWIGLGFPVVNNTGVVWTSRFDSMWALKGELWRARQDGQAPADWPIRHWVARDFIAGCPDIVVVDARANVGINYVAVLIASDAAFAQAWTHYHQIAMISGLRVLKREGTTCIQHSNRPKIASAAIQAP